MNVVNFKEESYADLFPATGPDDFKTAKFGAQNNDVDILSTQVVAPSTTESTTVAPVTTDTTGASTTDTTTQQDVDLFADDAKAAETAKKNDKPLVDLSSYFQERLKSGKFVPIEDEDENGKVKSFIPKTAEDFDEVIDIQVNHRIEEQKSNLNQQWYESKSPAWQAVARYAEMTDNPSDILPFLQGVRQIDSVKDLDPADSQDAEQIIRTRLQQKGDTEELIEEQIDTLKNADKLSKTANIYKPLILEQERQQLAQMVKEKDEEEQEWNQIVQGVKIKAIEAIEAPIFGKQKLKNDEKSAVFSLIGQPPAGKGKGYQIYTEIDNLFAKADFDMLTKLALLLSKKDAFIGYISTGAADTTSATLQRKLRIATENSTSSGNSDGEGGERKSVKRTAYNSKFGRQ